MQIQFLATLLFFQTMAAPPQAPPITEPTTTNIIFKSNDGGQTWADVSEGLPFGMAVSNVRAMDGDLYLASEDGLYRSDAYSATTSWEKDEFLQTSIWGIFPGKDGLLVGSFGNQVLQANMGTGLWMPKLNNLKDKTLRSLYEAPDGTVFIAGNSGIFKSSDEGETWAHVFAEGQANNIVAGDGALMAIGSKGLLRSTDGGEHWAYALTSTDNFLRMKRIEGGFALIAQEGTQAGPWKYKLLFSSDQGKTWQRMEGKLPSGNITDIEEVGEHLFCSHQQGIFRSSNWGRTWELVRPPLNERNMVLLESSGHTIYAVMFLGC